MEKNSKSNITLSGLADSNHQDRPNYSFDLAPSLRLVRIFAYLIDVVCLSFILIVVKFAAAIIGVLSFGLLSPLLVLIIAITPLAYHTYLIGSEQSATIGMRIMNIKVQTMDGRQPDYATAFLHCLTFYVSLFLTSGLILLVSLFTPQGRCLHDYLTNSTVVREN